MKRKPELFGIRRMAHDDVLISHPRRLYPQERDWTCSVACIRTMMSAFLKKVPSEETLVKRYDLRPGPHYSRDIKALGMLKHYDVLYGCDQQPQDDFDTVLDYVAQGYCVMLESMINYGHWMVLLGYYPLQENDPETSRLLMYDPYYDQVRLLNADEFISMWRDGNYEETRVDRDFIAIRR